MNRMARSRTTTNNAVTFFIIKGQMRRRYELPFNNFTAALRPVVKAPPTLDDSSSSSASPAKNNVSSTGLASCFLAEPQPTPA